MSKEKINKSTIEESEESEESIEKTNNIEHSAEVEDVSQVSEEEQVEEQTGETQAPGDEQGGEGSDAAATMGVAAEETAAEADVVEVVAEEVDVTKEDGIEEVVDSAEEAVEPAEDEAALSLEEELELARQEAAKNLENWQRSVAELANFKRRQEEQFKLQRDRIKSEVLQGVISALDDMDLAFQNLPEELDGQLIGWVEGFRLVQRKLDKILEEQNVMTIDTAGEFDPNFHEAVSYEENDEHESDTIIAELRKGYQIGSRVIRPALVRVAK